MAGYGGGYGAWVNRGNEEVKKQTQKREQEQKPKKPSEQRKPAPASGPDTSVKSELMTRAKAPATLNQFSTMFTRTPTEVKEDSMKFTAKQAENEEARAEARKDRGDKSSFEQFLYPGKFQPNLRSSMDVAEGRKVHRQSRPKFQGPDAMREMTDAEFRALPRKQRMLIEFNTEVEDLRRAGKTGELDKLFEDLNIQGLTREDFGKGRSIITDEDLWGTGKTRAPNKATTALPIPEGPLEEVTKGEAIDFADRQAMIDRLTSAVSKMFKRRDASEAMKMDAVLGQDNVNRAQGGALGGAASDFGKQLELTGEQEAVLAEMVNRTAKPSLWKAGATYDNVTQTLAKIGVSPEQWANYAGTVATYRAQQGRPLSGDPNDTFDIDQYMKQVGLKRQGK